ncbi:hypothetical protein QUF74_05650 [Candidatus Halobeggiatoa sp. HSG11]|nr:hypothetical protein [Candidatus Halobeggiatoa sp. HSG11]
MCKEIILPDGTEVETVGQFEQVFDIDLGETNINGHHLMRRDCLCQIDIDQAMFKLGYKKDADYEDDGMNIRFKRKV